LNPPKISLESKNFEMYMTYGYAVKYCAYICIYKGGLAIPSGNSAG
jgi:hypothetical protein